jgi:hypothetical protein
MSKKFSKVFRGLKFPFFSGTPSDVENGDMWFDGSTFQARAGNSSHDLLAGGGGGGPIWLSSLSGQGYIDQPTFINAISNHPDYTAAATGTTYAFAFMQYGTWTFLLGVKTGVGVATSRLPSSAW